MVKKIHSLKGGLYNFNEGEHQNTREPNIGGGGQMNLFVTTKIPPSPGLHKSEHVSLNDLLLLQYV